MVKLATTGYKASSVDIKALEHYLNTSPKEWAANALAGLINNAVKTIMRDWYEKYKSTQQENISTQYSVIIPAILAMPDFHNYNNSTPPTPQISRKITVDQEIWDGGFEIQDYELAALNALYFDPEAYLRYLMEAKIEARRTAMVKELESLLRKDPTVKEIPAHADDLILQETSKPRYKNRVARDAETTD